MSNPRGVPFPPHLPQRRVMVRMSIIYPTEVQADSSPEFVNFYLNEGARCVSDELRRLHELYVDDGGGSDQGSSYPCACGLRTTRGAARVKFEYVREATSGDK